MWDNIATKRMEPDTILVDKGSYQRININYLKPPFDCLWIKTWDGSDFWCDIYKVSCNKDLELLIQDYYICYHRCFIAFPKKYCEIPKLHNGKVNL